MAEEKKPVFKGYLKEINRVTTKSRWFVLEGPVLTKYYSKDATEATWRCLISGATIKENERKNEFRIISDKRIDLMALDKGDYAAWQLALKRATQLKPPPGFKGTISRSDSQDSLFTEAIFGEFGESNEADLEDAQIEDIEAIEESKRQSISQKGKEFGEASLELQKLIQESKTAKKEERDALKETFKKNHDAARALWFNCATYISLLEAERDTYKRLYNEKVAELRDLDTALSSLAKENLQMERRQTLELISTRRSQQKLELKKETPEPTEEDSDDDVFFDARERRTSIIDAEAAVVTPRLSQPPKTQKPVVRRARLPANQQKEKASVWNVMKNNLGKSLSKITLPLVFNEPIDFIQRCAEDLEYSHLLDTAIKLTDSCERMAYVAAFQLSAYSTTMHRTSKPFNPLLGETYECFRPERGEGWKLYGEQVTHHPPVSALHAEGNAGWVYDMTADAESAFKGTSLEVYPKGYSKVSFPAYNETIFYIKITTCVHNLVVGKMWVDNYGQAKLTNSQTGDLCIVDVEPYDWFKGTVGNLSGKVMDSNGTVKFLIKGNWNDSISIQKANSNEPPKLVWKKVPPPSNSKEQYNFTSFTISLNEVEGEKEALPPTDCRLRPDMSLYEGGNAEEAQKEKDRLEEKQRYARRLMEARGEDHQPRWFVKKYDASVDQENWIATNEYFGCREKKDWSRCPSIY